MVGQRDRLRHLVVEFFILTFHVDIIIMNRIVRLAAIKINVDKLQDLEG